MRGRKPTPTALKLVRGNPSKRPINDAEPRPPVSAGLECPDWLSPGAKEHWPIVAKPLYAAGLLTAIDTTALGLFCESFVLWKDANEKVAKFGAVVKGAAGYPVRSPYLRIVSQQSELMLRMLAEFGATPSSRSRCTVAQPSDPSPYAKFVRRT